MSSSLSLSTGVKAVQGVLAKLICSLCESIQDKRALASCRYHGDRGRLEATGREVGHVTML